MSDSELPKSRAIVPQNTTPNPIHSATADKALAGLLWRATGRVWDEAFTYLNSIAEKQSELERAKQDLHAVTARWDKIDDLVAIEHANIDAELIEAQNKVLAAKNKSKELQRKDKLEDSFNELKIAQNKEAAKRHKDQTLITSQGKETELKQAEALHQAVLEHFETIKEQKGKIAVDDLIKAHTDIFKGIAHAKKQFGYNIGKETESDAADTLVLLGDKLIDYLDARNFKRLTKHDNFVLALEDIRHYFKSNNLDLPTTTQEVANTAFILFENEKISQDRYYAFITVLEADLKETFSKPEADR